MITMRTRSADEGAAAVAVLVAGEGPSSMLARKGKALEVLAHACRALETR